MKEKLDRFNDEKALAMMDVLTNLDAIRDQAKEITGRLDALNHLIPRLSLAAASVEERAGEIHHKLGQRYALLIPHEEDDPAELHDYDRTRQHDPQLVSREVAKFAVRSPYVRRMDKFRAGPLLGWTELGLDGFRNDVYTLQQ